ncbi:MAG TPA: TlpA disulfide reductase family protein [Acidimicrobiales bacterium]|nr:TlpA disulfide reductase family protein [Acidimicrobiales bacterium]
MTAETLSGPGIATRMSARRAVAAVAVLISLSAVAAVFIGKGSGAGSGTGDAKVSGVSSRAVVPFTLPELREDRGSVSLVATPDRPTVVNFFAWWCEPCQRELPALRDAAAAHPEIAFLGVDHKDSRDDAVELLDTIGITYPAGYDPKGTIGAKYALRGLPATVFIGTDGRVVDFHQGELSVAELRERLDRLTLRNPKS